MEAVSYGGHEPSNALTFPGFPDKWSPW